MQHISTTPFGRRPVTAGLLAAQALVQAPCPVAQIDKWDLFHDLRTARAAFGVSDRDLTVLNALLSFLPDRALRDGASLIVHPSNASLSDRSHGMAESTLRRHLAALVGAGLIVRHDSPNGKRYVARGHDGAARHAFGFDLRPLLVRSEAIAAAADLARRAARDWALARERAVLALRDAGKLLACAAEAGLLPDPVAAEAGLAAHRRALRRRADSADLARIETALRALASEMGARIAAAHRVEITELRGNAVENGRHQQNSNLDSHESEPCQERQERAAAEAPATNAPPPAMPLALVLKAAPTIRDYAPDGLRSWHDLVAVAGFVRPMLGISADAWAGACEVMGREGAAITLACILERSAQIRSPGGYLRALTDRAVAAGFSPGPMVMALLRAENSRAL